MTRRGFSIIESMIATTVLATAVVGIASALATSHQQNQFLREQGVMLQLGRSLAEEIAAITFTDELDGFGNGWADRNFDRRTYDDIFDYDGYTDQSPFESLAAGGAAVDYAGAYRRSVTVTPLATPTTPAASVAVSRLAKVTITVSAPSGRRVELSRWVGRVDMERDD